MKIKARQLPIEDIIDLGPSDQKYYANIVSTISKSLSESRLVLPLETSEVLSKYLGYVMFHEGEFVGYVAASEPIEHNDMLMSRVGSLVVSPKYKRMGVGTELVECVSETLVHEFATPFAFCSPASQPAFRKVGYVQASVEDLPVGEFSPFGNQPYILPDPFSPQVI